MREFKFRAWTGKLLIYNVGINAHGKCIVYDYEEKKYIEAEVMQYTGLKDKNGKELYEGDFAEGYKGNKFIGGIINFSDGCFWIGNCMLKQLNKYIEVIDNIYQNPELLEVNT
jgi:uncharacterized phage protein (TIGR01671 family)